jgi:diguanylate cyclase (GGDEF)-like protein/PAS domain S-box-containing protein
VEVVANALQLIGMPACACDVDGLVFASNSEFDALLQSDPRGRNVVELFARHVRAEANAQLNAALVVSAALPNMAPRTAPKWDSVLTNASGNYVAVQLTVKALPGGLDGGATIIFNDISSAQRDQRALRKAMLEQQAILENAAVGIILAKDGHVVECNMRAAEMFGYARHELEGAPSDILYPTPEEALRIRTEYFPMLAKGTPLTLELQLRRRDGSLFWCRSNGRALDPADSREGTVFILEDINEQRVATDNASVGILFTKNQEIMTVNPRMAEMFGYTQEELRGRHASLLFENVEQHTAFGLQAGPLLAAGQLCELRECQLMRKDGAIIWCRVRAQAVDQEHNAGGTIWILEDVTVSRQTQMEVEAIMTNASITMLFTKNRLITRYNRGFADMFGYQGDEALGMPGRAIYPDDETYHRVGAVAGPLLSQGKHFHAETPMRRKDGSDFWAQLIGYVVNPDDPTQGTIWIIEDRTTQKQDEESLRNALLENQAILDSAVMGISVCEKGRNLRCNAKMEELFGYVPGEMSGVSVQTFYPDLEEWDAARRATEKDFLAGHPSSYEYRLVRKDGSSFWARLSGRPFDMAHPKGRSVWLIDDVTSRREAAEAVRRARDELEVRVLERTAELAGANAQLQAEIVERRQAEARVHHMAYHDSLTGLPNRALLADRLDRAMLAAQRSDRRLAVMFIDLDRFKTINDSLGHMTGDALLKEVAERLVGAVRASDTVARLGGDEFVVLLPGIHDTEESSHVAQKIIDMLSEPIPLEGRLLHITPSIGICTYPDDGNDVATLMRNADAAMYHAKASGRNNYQYFNEEMNMAAAMHFEMESSLRSALQLGQFELHYQPIMDIATRRLATLEVLLRWRRPAEGLVMPDQFIPLIEENGLIVPIGEWVLRRACEQSVEWQRQGMAPVPMAINLSARQFMHRGLVDSIRRTLDETGIDPALLEFEITETALMQHGEQTLEILGQINAMGIRLSIDDFGTGYSSLAYLKRFPVRKVKIDRAFIKDLEQSAEDRAIVAAIIALSDSLQLSVVAEGVETEGQFQLLREQGCTYAQGYLFSKPVLGVRAQLMMEKKAA